MLKYPRESQEKFARRNEHPLFLLDLLMACDRFAGYLSINPPARVFSQSALKDVANDMDGQGNDQDVFWTNFTIQAKARGIMFVLVDMDKEDDSERRTFPYCQLIMPEHVTRCVLGSDGRIDLIRFEATKLIEDEDKEVEWEFTREDWKLLDEDRLVIEQGQHTLGVCPVLAFSESGQFPKEGAFAQIADLSYDLFNRQSEKLEIFRSVTFPFLSYHIPTEMTGNTDTITNAAKELGVSNMLIHYGSPPQYIAPPNAPLESYEREIDYLRRRIDEVGLKVEGSQSQESGVALQMRFQALNSSLSKWAERVEDFEKQVWEMIKLWLGISNDTDPEIRWERSFVLADVAVEMSILQQMQASAMPDTIIQEQMKRIVSVQFGGLDQERLDEILSQIDEEKHDRDPDG
ncbi:MAG: hypothetical protein RBR42_05055 [Desulfomicrobium sp.]|nr:hypothetical protein [Desulfomicrobium sp.]